MTLDAIYVGVDDTPVPQHVVLDWIAAKNGLPPVPHIAEGVGQNKRLSNQRSRHLGYAYKYPDFMAGYGAVLAAAAE